jgi:hypothetical protein
VSAAAPRGPLAYGLGGGASAALVFLLLGSVAPGAARGGDFAALAVGVLAVHLGMRVAGGLAPRALIRRALALATVASATLGLGAYALYAWLRPHLLADRYSSYRQLVAANGAPAGRVAAELARLDATRAAYLDPAYQALSTAGTLFFVALLVGGYAGFRAHLARRLAGRGVSR